MGYSTICGQTSEEIEETPGRGHGQRRALEPGPSAPIMPPTLALGSPPPCGERQRRDVIKQTRVTSLPGSAPTWLVESDELGDASPWPPRRQQLINPAAGGVWAWPVLDSGDQIRQTRTFPSQLSVKGKHAARRVVTPPPPCSTCAPCVAPLGKVACPRPAPPLP